MNPYRTGFLNAYNWHFATDPQAMRQARRQNVLLLQRQLYHYTSLAGLKGIIEEGGFWASDNRFMNDAEEGWNGNRLARTVLKHRARRCREPSFAAVLRSVDDRMAAPREHGHLVACFSTVRDDLGQWRGYAAGGVCLRLGGRGEGVAPLFFGPDHLPHRAIYSDYQKRVLLLSVINGFEREYTLDRAAMPSHWPDDHDENYVREIHAGITGRVVGFKDRAFEAEAEARIVLSYDQADRYEGGLRFRLSSLGIVPYLRTGDHGGIKKHGGRLPLQEVIIGPAPHQDLIAESVTTFLQHHKYGDVQISLSRTPYRTL